MEVQATYSGEEVMEGELKPCPFCGGEAACIEETAWVIGCFNGQCAAEPSVWEPSKEMAITAWNTRADLAIPLDDPRVKALVEAAEGVEGRFYQAAKAFHNTQFWSDEEQDGQPLDDWVFSPIRAALSALEENK
jgi:hypothetical protein